MLKDIDLISSNYFNYSIDLEEPTDHVEVSHEGHGRTCTINVAQHTSEKKIWSALALRQARKAQLQMWDEVTSIQSSLICLVTSRS